MLERFASSFESRTGCSHTCFPSTSCIEISNFYVRELKVPCGVGDPHPPPSPYVADVGLLPLPISVSHSPGALSSFSCISSKVAHTALDQLTTEHFSTEVASCPVLALFELKFMEYLVSVWEF